MARDDGPDTPTPPSELGQTQSDPSTAQGGPHIEEVTPDEERKIASAPAFLIELDAYLSENELPDGLESSGFAVLHEQGQDHVVIVLPQIDENGINEDNEVHFSVPIVAFVNMMAHTLLGVGLRIPGNPQRLEVSKVPRDPFEDAEALDEDEETESLQQLHMLFAGAAPVRS